MRLDSGPVTVDALSLAFTVADSHTSRRLGDARPLALVEDGGVPAAVVTVGKLEQPVRHLTGGLQTRSLNAVLTGECVK